MTTRISVLRSSPLASLILTPRARTSSPRARTSPPRAQTSAPCSRISAPRTIQTQTSPVLSSRQHARPRYLRLCNAPGGSARPGGCRTSSRIHSAAHSQWPHLHGKDRRCGEGCWGRNERPSKDC
ncbi:hypothetical protein BD626DRAFT_518924 [Schizophyllum amplum]|uniref:Uncharacterized protein n=1 Tax=Schizophyllum amplum TaxID=97359 RepID=A0A550BVP2_9AGAR|nr:hypothetical protein BD626DRAFT_518924 [Auriculariopsis ampla]